MKLKGFALVAAVALAAFSLAACSSGSTGGDGNDSFLLYADLAMTGSLSSQSQALYEGMQAAAIEINKAGGIGGHKVELIKVDDQLDTTRAVTLLQQQLGSRKPNMVWHGQTSNQALALVPLLSRNKIISFGTAASEKINDPKTYPYAFCAGMQFASDARTLIPQIQKMGAKKIGFLSANDAYGQSTVAVYKPLFDAAGLDVTYEATDPTTLDLKPNIQRLLAAEPDLLIDAATQTLGSRVLQARTDSGTKVPMLATTALGNGLNLGLTSGPQFWDGVTLQVYKANSSEYEQNAGTKSLFAALRAEGSKLDQPMEHYSLPWDFMWLTKYAADQAKSIDPDAVTKALENLRPVSGSMIATFPSEKYSPENHFFVLQDPDTTYGFIRPGPVVDGHIRSVS
jgi:branched-chain amino acid transport system substrate-binding protein